LNDLIWCDLDKSSYYSCTRFPGECVKASFVSFNGDWSQS